MRITVGGRTGLIAVAAITAMSSVGTKVNGVMSNVASTMK